MRLCVEHQHYASLRKQEREVGLPKEVLEKLILHILAGCNRIFLQILRLGEFSNLEER